MAEAAQVAAVVLLEERTRRVEEVAVVARALPLCRAAAEVVEGSGHRWVAVAEEAIGPARDPAWCHKAAEGVLTLVVATGRAETLARDPVARIARAPVAIDQKTSAAIDRAAVVIARARPIAPAVVIDLRLAIVPVLARGWEVGIAPAGAGCRAQVAEIARAPGSVIDREVELVIDRAAVIGRGSAEVDLGLGTGRALATDLDPGTGPVVAIDPALATGLVLEIALAVVIDLGLVIELVVAIGRALVIDLGIVRAMVGAEIALAVIGQEDAPT